MDHYGLIDVLRDYCDEKGYTFLYGNEAYANALADQIKYLPDDIIMVADFTCIPTFTNGRITELRYNGVMMLGQKCEQTTKSTLDETPLQKFDNRLKALSTLLTTVIGSVSCENELEVINVSLKYDLNKFDLNADFVACTLTFVQ